MIFNLKMVFNLKDKKLNILVIYFNNLLSVLQTESQWEHI
jgi:hypothetical protein